MVPRALVPRRYRRLDRTLTERVNRQRQHRNEGVEKHAENLQQQPLNEDKDHP